ncbi:MAG: ribonuclease H family protein [Mycoplasmataceae bacterium]|nr:ribonuclease H family protein [Mycoplasmataceae bacterium]
MKKYYAVKVGKKTGVFFDEWANVLELVKSYPNAVYKGFNKKEEADEWFNATENKVLKNKDDAVEIYCDGSFFKEQPEEVGYGVIVIKEGKIISRFGGKKKNLYEGNNVAGEIFGVLEAIKYCLRKNYLSVVIYHDYAGLKEWVIGNWKTSTKLSTFYVQEYKKLLASNPELQVVFEKVKGHSDNKYNDLADKYAKNALLKQEEKK